MTAQQKGMFYGWKLLALATFCHCFGWAGSTLYTFSIFIVPIANDTGWSRSQISLASTLGSMTVVVVGPLVGMVIDKWGTRLTLIVSTATFGLMLALLYFSTSLQFFYIGFGLAALFGVGTMGPVYARLMMSWFGARKGLAVGVVMAGATASSVINPPILNAIVTHYGWHAGYLCLGVINLAIILPIHIFFTRSRPSDIGLLPDGASSSATVTEVLREESEGMTFAAGLRTMVLWQAAALFFLVGFGQGVIVHLIPVLESNGLPAARAVWIASLLGAVTFVSRVGAGMLMDRFSVVKLVFWSAVAFAAGIAVIALSSGNLVLAILGCCLIGIMMGAEGAYMGLLSLLYFGKRALGRFHTVLFSIFCCGSAIGVYAAGVAFDATGNYTMILWTAAALGGLSVLIFLPLLRKPRVQWTPQPAAAL